MQKETRLLFDISAGENKPPHQDKTTPGQSPVKTLAKAQNLEYEFLPEYLEVLERPPSSVARYFIASIIGLTLITLCWAIIGRIDIIASAPGKLIIDTRSKVIQAPVLGEVSQIVVKDGQVVRKGQLLIALNPTSTLAESQRLSNQLLTAELEISRINALLTDDPVSSFKPRADIAASRKEAAKENLIADHNNFTAQVFALQSQITQNKARTAISQEVARQSRALVANAKERLKGRKKLLKTGHISRYAFLELEKEVIEESRDDAKIQAETAELIAEGKQLTQQLNQLRTEQQKKLLDRLSELSSQHIDVSKQLIQADEQLRKMQVTASVDGVVQQLSVHTLGGVVQAAQELLILVPEGANLEAEVTIMNKDVGFIHPGQNVEIKVDSFPYTKYGTIKGKVINVSLDAMDDEKKGLIYPARVSLSVQSIQSDQEVITLSAGMSIAAEIKTGDRRVIDYLLSPLKEYQSESLKER